MLAPIPKTDLSDCVHDLAGNFFQGIRAPLFNVLYIVKGS